MKRLLVRSDSGDPRLLEYSKRKIDDRLCNTLSMYSYGSKKQGQIIARLLIK